MNFSDKASDFFDIIYFLEDELDIDIDTFEIFQNSINRSLDHLKNADIEILSARFALINFDEGSQKYLNSMKSEVDLKEMIDDIEPGYHPLMAAVNQKNYKHAEFLLQMGANPNQGTEPWFPLFQADSNRDIKMIRLLESFGADWDHNISAYEYWENDVHGRTGTKYNRLTKA